MSSPATLVSEEKGRMKIKSKYRKLVFSRLVVFLTIPEKIFYAGLIS